MQAIALYSLLSRKAIYLVKAAASAVVSQKILINRSSDFGPLRRNLRVSLALPVFPVLW
jgi:hypothetical protein